MANRLEQLTVFYHDKTVGLLRCIDRRISFIYDKKWLLDGFSISPRSLPLENRVFTADSLKYQGLFGVFADSLPDGWGTLTTIKYLRNKGISYLNLNPLEKLSLIGEDGLGALSYRPSQGNEMGEWSGTLDDFFQASLDAVEGEDAEFLDMIFAKESSTGGARPKAHIRLDGSEWIVKFRERKDPAWMGRIEYEYNLAAKEAGMEVPEIRLLPSEDSDGYFACKRFDRNAEGRVHMLSLSGLLEVPRDLPLLDYATFLQATGYITQSQTEVEKAFRLACFNVFSKNYDDHSKNFAFLYDDQQKRYVLAPAYDLTRTLYQKEHEMSCNGKGLPKEDDLLAVAKKVGIPAKKAEEILLRTKMVVETRLKEWLNK